MIREDHYWLYKGRKEEKSHLVPERPWTGRYGKGKTCHRAKPEYQHELVLVRVLVIVLYNNEIWMRGWERF